VTRMLVTVAHPDDETFGTGSTIAAAVQAGVEVTVCCATRGEAGEAHGLPPDADLAVVREAELRAAAEVLGVHRVVVLGYGDSGMDGTPAAGSLAAAPTDEVAHRVGGVVADVQPEVVITLDPAGGDGHRDHIAIAQATVQACQASPAVRVYAWTVTRSLLARWFAALENVRPESAHLDLDRQGLGRPDGDITTVLDVRGFRDVRDRAIRLHASQTTPFDGMPADLRDVFLDFDSLVRLQPPWTGGEIERELFGAAQSDRPQ
jgi:N-acetyl-1-D-myo-inositol-2-amino-2-deoxy-alpha-D-glucopyranoside deacetylase